MSKKYWIVTNHQYVLHKTEEDAAKEAQRLSKKAPGKRFWVFRVDDTVTAFKTPKPEDAAESTP